MHDIRHHLAPNPERRRPDPPWAELPRRADRVPVLLRPLRPVWHLPDSDAFAEQHPDLAARLHALAADELAFLCIARTLGASLEPQGHNRNTRAKLPRCPICQTPLALLVQLDMNFQFNSLRACREHPSSAEYVADLEDLLEEDHYNLFG